MECAQFITQINTLNKQGEVILTGDFNAKLAIKKTTMTQQQSKSGKYLQDLITHLELQAVSTTASTGTWTWVKRNNQEEHSVIDYIITSKRLTHQIKDNIVDEEGVYRIRGKKESDHNTMLINIGTNIRKDTKIIKRWKLNNKEGWNNFNKEIQAKYQ